jgi:hypothetical protein
MKKLTKKRDHINKMSSHRIRLSAQIGGMIDDIAHRLCLSEGDIHSKYIKVIQYALERTIDVLGEHSIRNQLTTISRSNEVCFCEMSQIRELINYLRCPCSAKLIIDEEVYRDNIYRVRAHCTANHRLNWTNSGYSLDSQYMALTKLIPAAIVLSGTTFSKFQKFCKIMKIQAMAKDTYHKFSLNLLQPIINSEYRASISEALNSTQGVIASDSSYNKSRNAKQCRTIFTNYPKMQIIHIEFCTKDLTGGNSLLMDPFNHTNGLQTINASLSQANRTQFTEIITDESKAIEKVLHEKYPTIQHSLDIWHKAKSLVKSFRYELPNLAKFVKKYFWSCCENCDGDAIILLACWKNIFRILRDDHSQCAIIKAPCPYWKTGDSTAFKLTEANINTISKGLNQRVNENNVKLLKNFRFTSEIESFNHILLSYCPKFSYYAKSWKMRIQIAALNWNARKGIGDIEQIYDNILNQYKLEYRVTQLNTQ